MNKLIHSGTMLLALLHPFLALANETLFSPTAKNMTGEWVIHCCFHTGQCEFAVGIDQRQPGESL